ncbi:sigma-70 family RNA polymerase sigma factor [Sorangium sp. So ce134]
MRTALQAIAEREAAFMARAAGRPGSRQSEVKTAAARDRADAFHDLFRAETARRVHRWLGKLRVPERDRGDLSQDVLLAAVMSFGSYDPSSAEVARWLNGIAVNVASHYHAKASRRNEVITDPAELCDAGGGVPAIELLLAAERRRLLRSLVLALPFELRSVLVQHDLYEISMRDIAETRSIPLSTAYRWRTRALDGAREALGRRLAAEAERCAQDEPWTAQEDAEMAQQGRGGAQASRFGCTDYNQGRSGGQRGGAGAARL